MFHATLLRVGSLALITFLLLVGVNLVGGSDSEIPERSLDTTILREAYAKPPAEWPAMIVDEGVEAAELGLLPDVEFPDDNPYSKEKAELGRQLFYDPRLSASGEMACASCHDPDLGWADGRTVSFGRQRLELQRNAPTAMNAGHMDILFWDGRADSLEDLTLKVIENEKEMHGVGDEVALIINEVPEYRAQVKDVFGEDEVTIDAITKAVATFVRTINGGHSDFDRFLKGRPDALSDSALRGLHLFRTKAMCMNCHSGPTLSDNLLHATGLSLYGTPREDLGAYHITGDPKNSGEFKTPALRHVSRTGPYMHHGLFESLLVTVRAYNGGMIEPRAKKDRPNDPLLPKNSPLLHELNLTDAELHDLVAFLESLEEPHRRVLPPTLPPFAEND